MQEFRNERKLQGGGQRFVGSGHHLKGRGGNAMPGENLFGFPFVQTQSQRQRARARIRDAKHFKHRRELGFPVGATNSLRNIKHEVSPTGPELLVCVLIGFDEHDVVPMHRNRLLEEGNGLWTVKLGDAIQWLLKQQAWRNAIVDECNLQTDSPPPAVADSGRHALPGHQTTSGQKRTPIRSGNSGKCRVPLV